MNNLQSPDNLRDFQSASTAGWKLQATYSKLPNPFFSIQGASPCPHPEFVVFNGDLASEIGLNSEILGQKEAASLFSGNCLPEGAYPLAQAYAGHQFGHFNILGDGRALLIGEQITPSGNRVDIELKGSGRTPYSRGGDGKAALGPMLREYLISEAMHALGIPTTRSLAVVTTGEPVFRERPLPGAVLTRVARSHIRVGTFEFAAALRDTEAMGALLKYAMERIGRDFAAEPTMVQENTAEESVSRFLRQICRKQAELISQWQLVGFVHGVMNTDNMSLSCETIDYGPCAFLDTYNLQTTFSSIDRQGRYAFGQQPMIGRWNLARFAETILNYFVPSSAADREKHAIALAEEALAIYSQQFQSAWLKGMCRKLGFASSEPQDQGLISDFLSFLSANQLDYSWTFGCLAHLESQGSWLNQMEDFKNWHRRWQERLHVANQNDSLTKRLILENNPAVIPRNAYVEDALGAAVEFGNFGKFEDLLSAVKSPFEVKDEHRKFAEVPSQGVSPYRTFCGT